MPTCPLSPNSRQVSFYKAGINVSRLASISAAVFLVASEVLVIKALPPD
jgi:hypothetical protein